MIWKVESLLRDLQQQMRLCIKSVKVKDIANQKCDIKLYVDIMFLYQKKKTAYQSIN